MWREETFDPTTIDQELGWAADMGFNSVRVFLHDLVWLEDTSGPRIVRASADTRAMVNLFSFSPALTYNYAPFRPSDSKWRERFPISHA